MEVYVSELTAYKLQRLTEYLLNEWGLKSKRDFLAKFTAKIEQISIHPESCPKSSEFKGIFKCVVTKQTSFFYRVNFIKQEIEIITIIDTRQHQDNPKLDSY